MNKHIYQIKPVNGDEKLTDYGVAFIAGLLRGFQLAGGIEDVSMASFSSASPAVAAKLGLELSNYGFEVRVA